MTTKKFNFTAAMAGFLVTVLIASCDDTSALDSARQAFERAELSLKNAAKPAGPSQVDKDQTKDTDKGTPPKKQEINPNLLPVISPKAYAYRLPKSVLVDLMSFLDDRNADPGVDVAIRNQYANELAAIKTRIMRHELLTASVRQYLTNLEAANISPELTAKVGTLKAQLGENPPSQQWEDFYGRVFDSAFVNELVENPPAEVLTAMTLMGEGIRDLVKRETIHNPLVDTDSGIRRKILKLNLEAKIRELLVHVDPRFWFPRIAAFETIRGNANPAGAVDTLVAYLNAPKANGYEAISIPYLIVKLGIKLRELGRTPKYLRNADVSYQLLDKMVSGIRINYDPLEITGKNPELKIGGLTLLSQPPVITADWMLPSERPTVSRIPRFIPDPKVKELPQARSAFHHQLAHGVTWASGMSGSTNIDLHMWHWLTNIAGNNHFDGSPIRRNVDPKAAFLGIIMFLVYDGGHTINEPLWAAHQIDALLGLNFNLSAETRMDRFLPDFTRFVRLYDGTPLKAPVENAFERAFEKTIEYFRKYSKYRDSKWKTQFPQTTEIEMD